MSLGAFTKKDMEKLSSSFLGAAEPTVESVVVESHCLGFHPSSAAR